jgi:hypothetical protein
MKSQFAFVVPALVMAGCVPPDKRGEPTATIELRWDRSSEPPLPVNKPPDSIVIRWIPAEIAAPDVQLLAERHCQAWKEHAKTVSEQTQGDARVTEFACKGEG